MRIEVRILDDNLVAIMIKIAKTFAKSFSLVKVFRERVALIRL